MFNVVKYITINCTKTYAQKCKKDSLLQPKIMLYATCPAYLLRQYLIYAHVNKFQNDLCKNSFMYLRMLYLQIPQHCEVTVKQSVQVNLVQ